MNVNILISPALLSSSIKLYNECHGSLVKSTEHIFTKYIDVYCIQCSQMYILGIAHFDTRSPTLRISPHPVNGHWLIFLFMNRYIVISISNEGSVDSIFGLPSARSSESKYESQASQGYCQFKLVRNHCQKTLPIPFCHCKWLRAHTNCFPTRLS